MLLAVYFVPVLMTVFVRLRTFEGQVYPYTMSGLITGWVLPIYLIVLVAESVTDDYVAGTMSLSLIHPVSRIQLITAKIVSLFILIVFYLVLAMLLGYGAGRLFFGWGGEFMIRGVGYSVWEGVRITAVSFFASAFPLLSFGVFVVFIALLLSSSAAVVGLATGIFLLFSVAELIFAEAGIYLITSYILSFPATLALPGDVGLPVPAVLFITLHGLFFYLLSLVLFCRKDILS